MNKPGRPKLPQNQKRVKFTAQVSPESWAKIEQRRKAMGQDKIGRVLDELLK